jgi:integrase
MGGRGVKHRKPYPYLHEIKDRHGHPRVYLRKAGCPSVALPLPVGSRAFLEAYHAALEAAPALIKGKAKPRTIAAVVDLYCHSRKWTDLSANSQRSYRYTLESFVAEHGHRLVADMQAKHVAAIMEARASTPVAANRIRKLLQAMMKMAIMQGWRKDNPCLAVDNFKIRSKGHRTWTDDEITAYRTHYAIGTEQRLAFELLLNTGQRVSDVVKMGRRHMGEIIVDGVPVKVITITQKKSGDTVEVNVPILPALKVALDELQARRITPTFLINQYGAARTEGGLSTMFIQWRGKAGLPDDLHAHGLRKAFCRVAAEAGLTVHEIMALSGHKSVTEVMRYTVAVDRKKLAASGMAKIEART